MTRLTAQERRELVQKAVSAASTAFHETFAKRKGPTGAATPSSPVSTKPSEGMTNVKTDNMAAVSAASVDEALGAIDHAEHLIHAAWMAARSLDGDERPAGDALAAVIHLAGEALGHVRTALRGRSV